MYVGSILWLHMVIYMSVHIVAEVVDNIETHKGPHACYNNNFRSTNSNYTQNVQVHIHYTCSRTLRSIDQLSLLHKLVTAIASLSECNIDFAHQTYCTSIQNKQ